MATNCSFEYWSTASWQKGGAPTWVGSRAVSAFHIFVRAHTTRATHSIHTQSFPSCSFSSFLVDV